MVVNVTSSRSSQVQTTQAVFLFIERLRPKLLSAKLWWQLVQQEPRHGPKYDFTMLWPWKVKVIREGRNNFYQTLATYVLKSTRVKFHQNLITSFFVTVFQSLTERWPGERKKKEEYDINTLTQVDTLWRKLHHEAVIWLKGDQAIIWRSFSELSFGISWASIHWAMEIEPPNFA